MPTLSRRELLQLVTQIALWQTVLSGQALARSARPLALKWLRDISDLCRDLRLNRLTQAQWREQLGNLQQRLGVADLCDLINFEQARRDFKIPDLGVATCDPQLPGLEGISEEYAFIGRIFGLRKGRAIIPHGHRNMVSCHRVLQGHFLLRQYDRVETNQNSLLLRPTVEETSRAGGFSSISEDHDNVHWLVATSDYAYTFDVIVVKLHDRATEIDNLDMDRAQKVSGGLLRVPCIEVEEALRKYGKTHH
ncbi:hypothetical protein JST97_05930 [bacterium]|nr:hypothetical protein [bacterium]